MFKLTLPIYITKNYEISKVCNLVADYFNTEIENLKRTSKNNHSRMIAIYLVRNLTQLSHQRISEFFTGIKRASISTTLIKCRKLIEKDACFKQHYLNLIQKIQNQS